jgi:hypothetical protein
MTKRPGSSSDSKQNHLSTYNKMANRPIGPKPTAPSYKKQMAAVVKSARGKDK